MTSCWPGLGALAAIAGSESLGLKNTVNSEFGVRTSLFIAVPLSMRGKDPKACRKNFIGRVAGTGGFQAGLFHDREKYC